MPNKRLDNSLFRPTMTLGAFGWMTGMTAIRPNTAFAFGSAGISAGWRFQAVSGADITDLYLYLTAVSGTGGTITVELRGVTGAGQSAAPNATVYATGSVAADPTVNRWNRVTFAVPFTPTLGQHYMVIVYNSDAAPGTNNFQFWYESTDTAPDGSSGFTQAGPANSRQTTNGWSTLTPGVGKMPAVLKHADGTVFGSPYTNGAVNDSGNVQRGMKVLGLPFDVAVSGIITSSFNTQGIKIYKGDSTLPSGTPMFTHTYASGLNGTQHMFAQEVILARNTVYRIVSYSNVSNLNPGYIQVGDYARYTDVQKAALHQDMVCRTAEFAGAWSDALFQCPRMTLIVSRVLPGGNSFSA